MEGGGVTTLQPLRAGSQHLVSLLATDNGKRPSGESASSGTCRRKSTRNAWPGRAMSLAFTARRLGLQQVDKRPGVFSALKGSDRIGKVINRPFALGRVLRETSGVSTLMLTGTHAGCFQLLFIGFFSLDAS